MSEPIPVTCPDCGHVQIVKADRWTPEMGDRWGAIAFVCCPGCGTDVRPTERLVIIPRGLVHTDGYEGWAWQRFDQDGRLVEVEVASSPAYAETLRSCARRREAGMAR